MSQDDGMDARLPISKEGLLAALDTAIDQAKEILEWQDDSHTVYDEVKAHIDYLRRLRCNIRDDMANNYPPVVRKRFRHDRDLI